LRSGRSRPTQLTQAIAEQVSTTEGSSQSRISTWP
jgi:hypothetical protein